MRTKVDVQFLGILVVMVWAAACGGAGLKTDILGKWEFKDAQSGVNMVFDFQKDGVLAVTLLDTTIDATYEWLDADTLTITMSLDQQADDLIVDVQLQGDRLILTSEGDAQEFNRVK